MMIPGFCLEILGTVFYAAVLHVVRKIIKTDWQCAPFYRIFYYIGIADVLHCICLFWMTFQKYVIHGDILGYVTRMASIGTCVLYLLNIAGGAIMAVNRYFATFITFHNSFSKRNIKLILSLSTVGAAVCSIPSMVCHRVWSWDGSAWKYSTEPAYMGIIQRYIIIAWLIIFLTITYVYIFMTSFRIREFPRNERYHKNDHTLLYFIIIHSFFQFWMLMYELFEAFTITWGIIIFMHEWFFVVFYMLTVSNAIFIFLFTPRVRRDLSNFMCQVMEISIRNGTSNTIPVLNVSAKY